MKNEKRNYVAVGTFVIAMVIVLIVWILRMEGQMGPTDRYSVIYANVSGLKAGTRILYEGYPVGLIDGISPIDRDGHRMFQVEVDVEKDWPVPVDSTARIATGIFSAPVIDIGGGVSQEYLPPGSVIRGQAATDIVATLNATAGKLEPILDELERTAPALMQGAEQLVAELNDAANRINEILHPENVHRVSNILENLEQATGETNQLLAELRKTSENVDVLIGHVDDLLDEESGDVSQAIDDARHTLATLARHIDAITSNLEDTTRDLNEFGKQLRANPGVLLRGRETADDGDGSR